VTRLLLSTRNRHKLEEVRQILGPKFAVLGLDSLPNFGEVEETGKTFEENAALKAVAASLHFPGLVLADDSGLEVDALEGAPGVYSARFAGPQADDAANNRLLLEKLASFRGRDRTARFRCVLAVAREGCILQSFSGSVEGVIIPKPKGRAGFGYDPLFVPDGFCQSFAELGPEIKNSLSHRSRALASARDWLVQNDWHPSKVA